MLGLHNWISARAMILLADCGGGGAFRFDIASHDLAPGSYAIHLGEQRIGSITTPFQDFWTCFEAITPPAAGSKNSPLQIPSPLSSPTN